MTDREMIEFLGGQILALTTFCGAMAQSQIAAKSLSPKFLEAYKEHCALIESYNVPKCVIEGIHQTTKELAVFFGDP